MKEIEPGEPIENPEKDSGKPKRHRSASTAELYTVLEALLPFARVEIECLEGYVDTFTNDPDHAEDAVRVQVGKEAIESAGRLIARKSATIRQKQKALKMYGTEKAEEAARQSRLACGHPSDADALAFIDAAHGDDHLKSDN